MRAATGALAAMPLDTGAVSPEMLAGFDAKSEEAAEPMSSPETTAFAPGVSIGAGLKAVREAKGLSVENVAEATRVRRHYLACLEAMDIAQLPSRPFAIGYVRAYARELGLDEELAVARFKEDVPDPEAAGLREPVGVPSERDPRIGLIIAGATVVIGAIVLWNVAQRGMAAKAPPQPAAVEAPAPVVVAPAQVSLGEALPPPVESTIPPPYLTPGLEAEVPDISAGPVVSPPLPEAPVINPQAEVFGAPAEQSAVMLRARKSASLIIRGSDGDSTFFANQLKPSEAYRLPMGAPLTIEVFDPSAFDVYVRGQFTGQLPALVTPAAKLGG